MDLTVKKAYEIYEKYFEANLKYSSKRSIRNHFNLFILPNFANKRINEIKTLDILKWEYQLAEGNYSYTYMKNIYISFHTFMNFCKKFLELEKNVVDEVGFIIKRNNEIQEQKFWTIGQYKKFRRKVQNHVYKYFFDFLFFTGCRLGEAIALTFNDIHNGTVSINKTKIRGIEKINSPKTKKSNRKFKIDLKLRIEIFILKNYYRVEYKNFQKDFYIFGGIKPLAPTTIERKKNIACKQAHVKQIKLHEFRHSHITMLLSKGIPVQTVCDRVGHAHASTTLDIYSHSLQKDEFKIIRFISLRNLLPF